MIVSLVGCGEAPTSTAAAERARFDGGVWVGSGNSVEDSTTTTNSTDSTVTARGGWWGGSGN